MTVRFEHETRIEAPAKLVFDLSLDIYAHRALMAASNERATAGVTSGPIGLGETVTWRAIHFRIPFTMTSRVTELERPHCFIDEQVRHTQPLADSSNDSSGPSPSAIREDATQRRRVAARDVHVCVPTQGRDKHTQPGFTVMGVPQDRCDCVRPVWRPRGTERTVATRRRRS